MKGIDPKWAMYLGLLVTIEQAIGHGTVSLTNLVPGSWAPYITSWCNFLAFVGTAIMTYQAAVSAPLPGPAVNTPISPTVKAAIIFAVLLGCFAFPQGARAQVRLKTPGQIQQDIDNALKKTNAGLQKQVASVTAKVDPAQPLTCDFTLLINLTPQNLVPTVKACLSDVNSTLVNDTQRALTSAKAYSSSGDNDAVNCLTPALAIFQAGVQVPAVPAVTAADGTVTTPAVPAQDPGPILLYQKYREFTLAGALTSCQAWFNGPINATAAAGIAGAGTAIAGAALLAPK